MNKVNSNKFLVLKEYIDEKDYEDIKQLEDLCSEKDNVNVKLELDFRRYFNRKEREVIENINEFLYYIDNVLAGYISISCFGGNIAEVTGLVHPEYRRKGIFKKLYNLALDECRKRDFSKILLLTDDKSTSGKEFIKSTGAEYDFSEHGMKLKEIPDIESNKIIVLRKALNSDAQEIARQNTIFFGDSRSELIFPEEEEKNGMTTYLAKQEGKVVGKLKIEINEASAFISGVGILPEYRSRGYGKEALREALRIIKEKGINEAALDVAAGNKNALKLYKSCGFEEEDVMNYYEVK